MLPDRDTKVGRIFSRLSDLPSLPKVVEKLLALSELKASTREFADLIATDQGLAAKVLRLVNSAFYSLRSPISSIRQASALLGVRTLKSLALSVSVVHIFKRKLPCFDPVRFWRHSLAAALASSRIAQRAAPALQEEAYIAGLLHDIGVALLVQHYPVEFEKISAAGTEGSPEALAQEAEEFGQSHPEVGATMAGQWRLPALITHGLRHHHTPLEALPADLPPESRLLAQVVRLADGHARRAGHSFSEVDRIDPQSPLEVPPGLDVGPDGVAALVGDLDRSLAELEGLYLEERKGAGAGDRARPELQA